VVAAAVHGEAGVLRVGFIGTATYDLLPRLIPAFRARYPAVDLQLTESTTQGALDGLAEGRLDVGLVRYPVLAHGAFALTPLDEDDLVLAVPDNAVFAALLGQRGPGQRRRPATGQVPGLAAAPVALSRFADQPFVMYARAVVPNLYAVAMMRCQHSGFAPRVAQEAVQVPTILSLVASGLGVALVAGVAQRQATEGVRFLALSDTPAGFKVGMALATATQRSGPQRLVQSFAALAHAAARR